MYKIIKNYITQQEVMVLKIDTNTFIPLDTLNYDYQQYLKWLEEGNTPQPADAPADA